MQSSPLSLAYTSSTYTLPPPPPSSTQRNFPPTKPYKPSYPLIESDLSHEVVIAEDTVGRSSLPSPLPSPLTLLLSSQEVTGLEDRVRYVHECLNAVKAARERGEGSAGVGGPEEELGWAIQSLQSAIRERGQVKKGDEYLVQSSHSFVPSLPSPSLPELSNSHQIVSEDVIPSSLTAALLYSSNDGSNRDGYSRAHEESLRMRRLEDRVEYVKRCLAGVVERGRVEREGGEVADRQMGPEEGKAWERVCERQERERKGVKGLRSKL